jgi:uncharacterized protein YndB with AHSA1/START domain
MKALKILGLLVLGLVLAFLGVGLVVPNSYSVERSVTINQPRADVFKHVASLREQQRWSPWADRDPNQTVTYAGTDGAVGSRSTWAGNSDVGKGEQEIKAVKPNELVHNEVRFIEPLTGVGQAYIRLQDEARGTRVSWQMTGESPYPWNALSVFMNLDNTIGKDFDTGLGKLKTLSEQPAVSAN